jgi:hypothetical protein
MPTELIDWAALEALQARLDEPLLTLVWAPERQGHWTAMQIIAAKWMPAILEYHKRAEKIRAAVIAVKASWDAGNSGSLIQAMANLEEALGVKR